ncbi:MAG: hypothetical protein M9894_19545 [Planctomycetes bacterium]|nr:hypothetical protein [Planctomycetota bacterium]
MPRPLGLVALTCLALARPLGAQEPPPRPVRPAHVAADDAGGNGHAESWDGRLFVITRFVPGVGDAWGARVLRPERIGQDAAGRPRFDQGAFSPLVAFEAQSSAAAAGLGLLNALALVPWPGVAENPYRSDAAGAPAPGGAFETYDLLVVTQRYAPRDDRLGRLRYRVVVAAPRTADARVERVTRLTGFEPLSTTAGGPLRGIEPTVTFDGHLLVWQGHPANDARIDTIVYSYNQTPGAAAGWSPPRSLADMHEVDRATVVAGVRFDERFPLAERPLRASDGEPFRRGDLYVGAYPWISHDGSELVHTATIAGQGDTRARRGGLSVIGRLTGWALRHVDGPLNPDREASVRLFTSSPGLTPGLWTPFRDAPRRLPYGAGRPVYPLFSSNTHAYGELDLSDAGDGEYVLALRMNEAVTRQGTLDPRRTPDTSGHARAGRLEGGAAFPQELTGRDASEGLVGQSIYFPDAGLVRVPGAPALSPREALTVSVWVRRLVDLDQDGENRYRLLVHQPGAWHLILEEDGRVHATVRVGGQERRSGAVGPALALDRWTHVAFTYAAPDGRLRVFVDGAPAFTRAFGPGAIDASTADLLVGPGGQTPPAPFVPAGRPVVQLDELLVSRVARTDREVADAAYRASPAPATRAPATPLPLGLDARDARLPAAAATGAEAVALGERLFFDPRLSRDGTVSCATCHDPARAFTDGLPRARGVGGALNERNTPTVLNRLFSTRQLLDGRADDLEAQATLPIEHPDEMGLPLADAAARLATSPEYADRFRRAFGRGPDRATISAALAAFQRTLLSGDSRVDRFEAGDRAALTPAEVRGRVLFHGKARCTACHVGSNYTDEAFHDTAQTTSPDPGRARVTGRASDRGRLKTPTLRDVSRTAPYLHDGSVATLEEVVDLYDRGGVRRAGRDIEVRPLGLTAGEKADLVAFLRALDGPTPARPAPTLPAGVPVTPVTPTSTTPTAPTPDAEARWLGRVYQALVGRAPTAAELDAHRRELAAGAPAAQVVRGVLDSAPARARRVTDLFRRLLGRAPDAAGLAFHVDALGRGQRLKDLEVTFLVSAEYRAARPTREALVRGYCEHVLGRPADAPGLAYHVAALAASADDVVATARAFVHAGERHRAWVAATWRDVLGRSPTTAELTAEAGRLDGGEPLEDALARVLASDELRARP